MNPKLLFSLLPLAFLCSCGERITQTLDDRTEDQYAYFPLESGFFREYVVDSSIYDFAAGSGTIVLQSRTWVREQVGDTLRDNTGALMYRIERFEKKEINAPWELKHINTAGIVDNKAVSTENNLRFLKMPFPMDRRSEWNGNVWLDAEQEIEIAGERVRPFSNWRYEVDSIDFAAQIGAFAFDSLLVITEADDENLIERRLSIARYAKNVGLVQREQWILDSQYCNQNPTPADCATKPWLLKAEKGYLLQQTLLDYKR